MTGGIHRGGAKLLAIEKDRAVLRKRREKEKRFIGPRKKHRLRQSDKNSMQGNMKGFAGS